MSRPIKKQSHEGAQSTGAGESHRAKGHNSVGLFVVVENLDAANDTVDVELQVEGPDGEWAPIRDGSGAQVGEITTSEFANEEGSVNDTAMVYVHGVPAPKLRANITGFNDAGGEGDLAVDTYVLAANNGGTGFEYESG